MGKEMYVGGVNLVELANKIGTPLCVYDEGALDDKMQSFHDLFKSDVFDTEVLYASKAFSCKAIYELAAKHGLAIDVVSGGELYTAHAAGFPMEKVYFHGNNKTIDELELAFDYGVGCIVADNQMECEDIAKISNKMGKKMNVMLRVNPGVEAHTHKYIVTAHLDSKFGTSITMKDEIAMMVKSLEAASEVSFIGFHAHIGSQIFDKLAFKAEIETMMNFMAEMKSKYGISCKALNLGGGFAAYYTNEDHPIPLAEVCEMILTTCKEEKERLGLDVHKILIEPGRSIVAEAGSNIYRIGYQKQTANKRYVFVDGGMSDNIRPALYQAKYACDVINKMDAPKEVKATIAGKCCESGDILIEDAMIPEVEKDDLLIIYTTGAYGYSMASNYNRLPKIAVVFVKDGKARVVIKKESYEDMMKMECDEAVNL